MQNNGESKSHQVLGTARSRTGHVVTFVRVEFEKSNKVPRLLWFNDKMTGHGSGVPRPAVAQYMPESATQFTSFDILTSQLTHIGFDRDAEGKITSMQLPSAVGATVASKKK